MNWNFDIRITLIYLFFGIGWILLTDILLQIIVDETGIWSAVQSIKGVMFVAASSVVIYYVARYYMRQQQEIRKKLLKEKNRAEENDRLKAAFLANLSHEIRTPMNGIMGFLTLLENPCHSQEHHEKYLELVKQSGERMLETINNIIEMSRIESEELPVHVSPANVNSLLTTLYKRYLPEAELKGIRLNLCNEVQEKQLKVETDKQKLIAILDNLVKNALKFTPEGTVEIGCRQDGIGVLFYIRDTGIGIPDEWHDIVFERFARVDATLSSPYEGLGLGLPIAHFYTRLIGGKLWFESQEGNGSTFWLSVPAGQERFEAGERPSTVFNPSP